MKTSFIPAHYQSTLTLYETQAAISLIKFNFEENFARALNLRRVSAPLFVDPATGLNDDLNGVERPVTFDIPAAEATGAVVHSLAKWKRLALYRYGFKPGKGLYTDMNAIRRDEELDNLHSVYVDQWDWEKVITPETRNIDYLKAVVRAIVTAIIRTKEALEVRYPQNICKIEQEVKFITAEELLQMYPDMPPKDRENAIVRKYKTVFIIGIGDRLSDGKPHDGRAPDYDDWQLNGDLLLYHEPLDIALEISSMGIRVTPQSLHRQLTQAGCLERLNLPFHTKLMDGILPLTMGGGIGQSRLCMFLLQKAHIGEVQCSLWDKTTLRVCEEAGVQLF